MKLTSIGSRLHFLFTLCISLLLLQNAFRSEVVYAGGGGAGGSGDSRSGDRNSKKVKAKVQRAKDAEKVAVETGGNEISPSGFVLNKTHYNHTTRLLFVAGLEGTGHHALNAMMKVCSRTLPHKMCEVSREISMALQNFNNNKNVMNGLFSGTELISDAVYIEYIEQKMMDLRSVPGEHLYFLGLGFATGAGMMSYPNYDGRFKSMDHPDVVTLAHMAENVGIDFRVLVLQRDGGEILASTMRRGFGSGVQAKVLIDNAAALSSQLSMLNPDFFLCMRLTDVQFYTTQQNQTLRDFLHPVNMRKGDIFQHMLQQIRPSSSSSSQASFAGGYDNRKGDISVTTEKLYESTFTYEAFMLETRLHLIDDMCASNAEMRKRRWEEEEENAGHSGAK